MTDTEIAAGLAEVMGGTVVWRKTPTAQFLRVDWKEGELGVRFDPLADTDAGWADFGRVVRWVEADSCDGDRALLGLAFAAALSSRDVGACPRRALCLAILKAEGEGVTRAQPEADLSAALAQWLALTHPHDNPKGLFYFMVPNEGFFPREKRQRIGMWRRLIRTGLRPGVADWCFVWNSLHGPTCKEIGFIELKAGTNDQRPAQLLFQQEAEAFGLRYAVCRSVDECVETLKGWGAA